MADTPQHGSTILRRKHVEHETGLARSTIYSRVGAGLLTKPVGLGGRAVGWPAAEIHALNMARVAGKTDDEIRDLVNALELARATASRQL